VQQTPEATTAVETAALVGQHEHDLPLKDAVVNQAAADAGDVLVALHLLELATQKERRAGRTARRAEARYW
jgi:hypothetical protein